MPETRRDRVLVTLPGKASSQQLRPFKFVLPKDYHPKPPAKRAPSQNHTGAINTSANFFKTGREDSYLRNAYKVRIIPARQNPSKNLSVLNIVTFTDRATVRPKIRMKMMEQSSTGRRPTLCTERKWQESSLHRAMMPASKTQQMLNRC